MSSSHHYSFASVAGSQPVCIYAKTQTLCFASPNEPNSRNNCWHCPPHLNSSTLMKQRYVTHSLNSLGQIGHTQTKRHHAIRRRRRFEPYFIMTMPLGDHALPSCTVHFFRSTALCQLSILVENKCSPSKSVFLR